MTIVSERVENLFEVDSQTIVCPVNTVGAMGSGIARYVRDRCPDIYQSYKDRCRSGSLIIGELYLHCRPKGRWVLCFPTKEHWKDQSKLEYIDEGLECFVSEYRRLGVESIAFPAIGCGYGGLDFANDVRPLLYEYLDPIDIPVRIVLDPVKGRYDQWK